MIYFNLKTPAKKFKKKQFILTLKFQIKIQEKTQTEDFSLSLFIPGNFRLANIYYRKKRNQKQTIFYLVNPAAVAVSIFDATVEFLLFAID